MHDSDEMEEFIELMSSCKDDARSDVSQRNIVDDSGEELQRVTLTCGDYQETVDYYFDYSE